MKYIRTKDGKIIEYQSDFYKTDVVCCKDEFVFKEEIINQADTIEELCDEFVLWFKEFDESIQFSDFETAKQYRKAIVYGAIWTDKGLIYVAKMNDKGELELL